MALTHFPPITEPAIIAEHIRQHGFAIVDDLADANLLERVESETQVYIDASAPGRDEYDGRFTRRTGALIARSPASRELVMNPVVVATVKDFLSHATAIQLHMTQIISISPGETQQKLHRDEMAFDFFPFPSDYHVQCNTLWALSAFTRENGATHLCPGTSGIDDKAAARVDSIQAEMCRGACLFYDGKILHGGGANLSDQVRTGVNLTYAVGWVRQEENQYLACPADIARTLDDDLLRMMGYQAGAFAMGYVGDQLDPLAVLRGTETKVKIIGDFGDRNPKAKEFVK
ncbi:MAG: phytanoyl-CoA dioxygenase family protein [Gammaproteobacteria bacterium]|nr:MAG: phytanoyl-CoA dioxygenase family protein [Gammaproteobacteria bacterium]